MAALTGNTIADTYTELLRMGNATLHATTGYYIKDSADTNSALSIATTRVGIGTTSPATALHVESAGATFVTIEGATGNNKGIYFQDTDGGDGDIMKIIRVASSDKISIQGTDGSPTIATFQDDSGTGKVGIGTSSPGTHLHIAEDDGSNYPILTLERTDSTVANDAVIGEIDFVGDEGGAADVVGSIKCIADTAWASNDQPTYLAFSTCKENEYAATEKMRITMDGDVGINETAPSTGTGATCLMITHDGQAKCRLRNSGSTVTGGEGVGAFEFVGATDGAYDVVGSIECVAHGAWDTDDSPTKMYFKTTPSGEVSNDIVMTIDKDGKVGIGADPVSTLSVAGIISIGENTEVPIISGAITVTQSYHDVETEGDASSDDLNTINGGVVGAILVLTCENTSRTVVVHDTSDGGGNINLAGGSNFSMTDTADTLMLIYNGANWLQLGQNNN